MRTATWARPPAPEVRATLAHDPAATPCWCGRCHAHRCTVAWRALTTPTPPGAGSMSDPDGYGPDGGHLVDPGGTGQGRWLADRGGMWREGIGTRTRKDFLR